QHPDHTAQYPDSRTNQNPNRNSEVLRHCDSFTGPEKSTHNTAKRHAEKNIEH
ncbi:MAG: hypothetical protein HQM12_08810, partial [SAR324 cluster bacterium]|nr:hypothetical protein [SAR324 cluster bacterium]